MMKAWTHVRRYIYNIDNLVILGCGFYHFQNIVSLLQNIINISCRLFVQLTAEIHQNTFLDYHSMYLTNMIICIEPKAK